MKNIKKISFLSIIFVVLFVACSDEFLLDTNNKDLTEDIVYGADATAVAAVTGVYDGFQNASNGDPGLPNEYNVKEIFRMANNLTLDWQDSTPRASSEYWRFDLNPDGDVPVKIWPNNYRAIGRANNALANLQPAIDAGNVDAELGSRLIGEVLVLRALSYQYLVATYGGVPLMLDPLEDPFKARDTQEAVFQQIVNDMEDAINRLPWEYEVDKGRATKGAAYAVLGNAHMWLEQ